MSEGYAPKFQLKSQPKNQPRTIITLENKSAVNECPASLDNRIALMYLIDWALYIGRQEVERLANTYYNGLKEGSVLSLADLCESADIQSGWWSEGSRHLYWSDKFDKRPENPQDDLVLPHLTVNYPLQVLEGKPKLPSLNEGVSVANILAGSGPARPFLLDIYWLDSLREIRIVRGPKGNELFHITNSGGDYGRTLRILFADTANLRGKLFLPKQNFSTLQAV